MMKIISTSVLSLLLTCFISSIYCQIPPNLDNNWKLNTKKSDEFNDTILDDSKWDVLDISNGIGYSWGGAEYFRPENVAVDNNILQLIVERKPNNHNKYYSGGVRSVNHNFSYGYFEIYAKLPGFYNNGIPCGDGFWPAFWTYYVEEDEDGCRIIHDEIDILEPSGRQYANAKSNVAGWHDEHPDCEIDHIKVCEAQYNHNQPLFKDYHKYAVEWLPDRIIFYFDDQPFYAQYNHPKMIMKPQYVVIDQQMDKTYNVNSNTPFPQYMLIDYFRYYELNTSFCEQTLSITSNSQLNKHLPGVRKNIIIGDGTNSLYLSNNQSITLRATNEITINGDFIVPIGCELNLIPTPCY